MKRTLQWSIGLLYNAALLFALVVLLKSGASIFYAKHALIPAQIIRSDTYFEYRLPMDSRIFDADTVLVLENSRSLEPASPGYVAFAGSGNYAAVKNPDHSISVYFVPSTPSDPANNGMDYQIFIRPVFLSSDWGGRLLLLLLLGLAGLFWPVWRVPEKRSLLLKSPLGFVKNWERLFERPAASSTDGLSTRAVLPRRMLFKRSAVQIVWFAFFYALMEWIFFVTKPSFMDILSLGEKMKIFVQTGLWIAALSLIALIAISLVDLALRPVFPSFYRIGYHVPAAFLAACLSLILFDNFTYTVLKFGIVNTSFLTRSLYALGFCWMMLYFIRKFAHFAAQSRDQKTDRTAGYTAAAVFSISLVFALFSVNPEAGGAASFGEGPAKAKLPNIILFGTDGMNAAHMSAYGYERETTPFIAGLAQTALVSENNFTNSAHSTGSDTALLTSKLPFETRVLFPPDTLKGSDKYMHLPGILQHLGYRTVSLGVPYYVDADTINFQKAFDSVNCVEKTAASLPKRLAQYGFDDILYFFSEISGRISERLAHIFFLEEMENRLSNVNWNEEQGFTDQQRMDCLWNDLRHSAETGQPVFAHVHLMATHGSKFSPEVHVFSEGQDQTGFHMTDFYDDAILSFDIKVERLVAYLKELGMYDNTILVLYTDHGAQAEMLTRLPLIMRFPEGQHAKRITANTQNLDIAPTLLDYLELEKPQWMNGSSLLGAIDPQRLIIAGGGTNIQETSSGQFVLSAETFEPPYYQFGVITVTQCQRAYVFNLIENSLTEMEIDQYPNPCPPEELDTSEAVRNALGAMLAGYGFELSQDSHLWGTK